MIDKETLYRWDNDKHNYVPVDPPKPPKELDWVPLTPNYNPHPIGKDFWLFVTILSSVLAVAVVFLIFR